MNTGHRLGCLLLLLVLNTSPSLSAQAHGDTELQQLLSRHCIACHSDDHSEAGIRLDEFHQLERQHQQRLLNQIEEQVYLRLMPPADQSFMAESDRVAVLRAVTESFGILQVDSDFRRKLKSPGYGNYIDHTRLFSGEITTPSWSPARLWRTSPHVFDSIKSEWGGVASQMRQPFIIDDKQGIRDYAALLFADSAVVDVLIANAAECADQLLQTRPQYQSIAESPESPSQENLAAAIDQHFQQVVYRQPREDELQKYVALFRKTERQSDNKEALRISLMAVMLHQESVYRIEIGLGASTADGRQMLSPVEIAFAISYALTDRRPDQHLLQIAQDGQLSTAADAGREVDRILADPYIRKPRILRFFQEFFGYTQAHKVFKDAARSGGFAYYGENYPEMYERDADFFVLNILDEDRDVFRRLLTSDEFFILNRQTFRNTVYHFYQQNRKELDEDVFPEVRQQELLQRLGLRNWGELNDKYHLHKFNRGFRGDAAAIRQIVKEARQWKNTDDEEKLLHAMQPLYRKYPMVYDLQDDEQDFLLPQPYKRPNRAGILTHPAWLIAHSLNDSTDPIRRGKWIRERLLAGTIPELPITVDATIPVDHTKTLRERLAVTEQQACYRCHRKMNPLGYAFEIYDDFGRFRTAETLDQLPRIEGQVQTKPVVADGTLNDTEDPQLDGEFDNALQLIQRLAESDRVRQSIIRHAFRYFLGRNEMLSDSQTLIAADRAYIDSGGSFRALLGSLLTSDSFLYRRQNAPPGDPK